MSIAIAEKANTDYTPRYTKFADQFFPPESDPYLYGWRIIQRVKADGSVSPEYMPLTLEDILHPQEEDFRVHTTDHTDFCTYIETIFINQLKDDPLFRVFQDVRIKWDHPWIRPHGPDVIVVHGVEGTKNWSTFDISAENAKPLLIVEVVSPSTRLVDVETKVGEYALVGVPYYIIIDRLTAKDADTYILRAYELQNGRYQLIEHDQNSRVWLPPVNCSIGIEDNRVACYSKHGERLLGAKELDSALKSVQSDLEQEKARAEQEATRANAAEAEIERLKALLAQRNA